MTDGKIQMSASFLDTLLANLKYDSNTGLDNSSGDTSTLLDQWEYYKDYHYHYYHNWYPSPVYIQPQSKVEQAFKIVGALLKRKLISTEISVKQFIELVNDIAGLL